MRKYFTSPTSPDAESEFIASWCCVCSGTSHDAKVIQQLCPSAKIDTMDIDAKHRPTMHHDILLGHTIGIHVVIMTSYTRHRSARRFQRLLHTRTRAQLYTQRARSQNAFRSSYTFNRTRAQLYTQRARSQNAFRSSYTFNHMCGFWNSREQVTRHDFHARI